MQDASSTVGAQAGFFLGPARSDPRRWSEEGKNETRAAIEIALDRCYGIIDVYHFFPARVLS